MIDRRSFIAGLVTASLCARPPAALLGESGPAARDVAWIDLGYDEVRFSPRLVLLARRVGDNLWERVAETPFDSGDYVTATFEAKQPAHLEFKCQVEVCGFPPFPRRWMNRDGPYQAFLEAGETATADCGRLVLI